MISHVIGVQQIWKTQQWPQDWKRSILIPVPMKDSTKECANHQTVTLISHASKVMFKILNARLQHYMNQELPDVQAGFKKGRGIRNQIANVLWIIEKQGNFRNIYFCFVDYAIKPLTVCILTNCGKLFSLVQFSSSVVSDSLRPMNHSTPGLPVHHQLLESTQTHIHRVSDAIQPSHPLSSPSHPAFNLSQHQGLFKWVSSSHQVAKVLEFQLQHQSFQWIFRIDFL